MIPPIKRINKIGKPLHGRDMDLQKNTITYLLKKNRDEGGDVSE